MPAAGTVFYQTLIADDLQRFADRCVADLKLTSEMTLIQTIGWADFPWKIAFVICRTMSSLNPLRRCGENGSLDYTAHLP